MRKVPTMTSLALKASEIVSVMKQKLYMRNQRELKLLVLKIQIVPLLDENLKKIIVIFSDFISFFFLKKKYKVMPYLAVPFQRY